MTSSMSKKKINISATEKALADVSCLISRLCNSRKANMKLQEIISLTGSAARLTRALLTVGIEHGESDGYGDPGHAEKISVPPI